ncbi:hypothetical protein PU630_07805 [Microbacterium horticulturae]|uniref:Uncharacterized protein n=1 Tax=Microbacterium horticulturae TaxID=3028316 RepID=A0ABY8C1W0_9MICO|nr:hypothetical protein [Microbacterium sp. KACC 23027]WEG10435.1 hypothetical protein PU630_07805 [Microbacterium sp. KACC 23027]
MASTISLPAGPRPIRSLRPPEAPWNAVLAQAEDGSRCLLVDAVDLTDEISWRGSGAEHLAAVTELVRTARGVSGVLPVCTQPLTSFLERRSGEAGLTPGEAVTLAVSLVRGAAEALTLVPDAPCGTWWLDDSGRPLLVGGSEQRATQGAADLVAGIRVDAATEVAAALRFAEEVLSDPRRLRGEALDVEAALFSAARAEQVATAVLNAPRSVRVTMKGGESGTTSTDEHRWAVVARNVDAGLGDLVSHVVTALWRRLRTDRPRGGKKHPLIAAGVVGALVLGAGLLWPRGGADPAVAEPRHPTPAATAQATETSASSPVPTSSAEPDGLAEVAAALLDQRAACETDACRSATQEDADAHFSADVSPGVRRVTLLDDFGGAAVMRVGAEDTADLFVVIVRRDGKWLLRDIRDVAEQPEGRSG